MKRINYFVSLLLVLFVVLFAGITTADAVTTKLPASVTTDKIRTVEYFKNWPVIVKTVNSGKNYVFCLNKVAKYEGGIKFSEAGTVNDGFLYILNNKPNTGEKDLDFYIMQNAVWYYQDYLLNNNTNLDREVKNYILTHRTDTTGLYKTKTGKQVNISKEIYDLYLGAKNYVKKVGTLAIEKPASLYWTEKDGYYVSQDIKVNKANLSTISYKLNNATLGSLIVTGSTAGTIKVKVPVDTIPEGKKITMTLLITGSYYLQSAHYYYHNGAYQRILYDTVKSQQVDLSDSYDMTLIPQKKHSVTISKVDSATNKGLAGATLVIYNSKGTAVEEWVSTANDYKTSLVAGTYTLKETKAPANYVLNTTPVKFVIDEAGNVTVGGSKVTKVVFKNTKIAYKVEFNMHGHGSQVPTQSNIPDGGKATKPTDPTATGWKFEGWYIDAAYTKLYDFNTAIHENKVLHAKWTQVFKVEFDMHGHGAQVPTQNNIPDGGKATKPTDPTAQGWKFEGWYVDAAYTKLYDFNTAIHENKVLHAKWTQLKYKVEFVMNGHGTQVPTQNDIPDGGKATKPTDPTEEGWVFGGWYIDAALTTLYDFNTLIHENKVLYAKWTKAETKRYEVIISKTDVTKSKEIAGATLVITDAEGKEVERWTSTTTAHKVLLEAGKYTLKETAAPSGYKLSTKKVEFMIDANGVLYEKNEAGTYVKTTKLVVVNELLDVVSIVKKDKDTNKMLKGAVLVIKDAKGNIVKEFTSTDKAASFKLAAGEYSLEEKTAPNGYVLSNAKIYFKLLNDGTLQVKNNKGVYADSTDVTFYNEKKKEEPVPVPKTDLDSTVYIMGGLALLASGVYFANKTIKEY